MVGPAYASSSTGRRDGYLRALRERGIEPGTRLMRPSAFSIEAGEEAASALFSAADRPTAVFAVNDNTAIGVLTAAHRAGLAVPGDVSIVGYNDIPLVGHLPLPLTTMRVPFRDIATSAADLLLADPVPGSTGQRLHVHAPTLIPRASTAPPSDA